MFQHTPILLLRFTCVNFHQKKQQQHIFILQLGFISVPLPFIILYSPYSNLLDNVWRFTQVRFTLLCIFSQTIFLLTNSFTKQQQRHCKCSSYYYRSPSHTGKSNSSYQTIFLVFLLLFPHHGAYSLIITISIYSIHKTVYSNFQKTVKSFIYKIHCVFTMK